MNIVFFNVVKTNYDNFQSHKETDINIITTVIMNIIINRYRYYYRKFKGISCIYLVALLIKNQEVFNNSL